MMNISEKLQILYRKGNVVQGSGTVEYTVLSFSIQDTEEMGLQGEPICVRTLSNH